MAKKEQEKLKPVILTDHDTGTEYELDFSRESVKFAEARGFDIDDVPRFPATKVPELFFYAFRKNNKYMARSQTDELLEKLGGLTSKVLERLSMLYNQACLSNVIQTDEEAEKNAQVTVEL